MVSCPQCDYNCGVHEIKALAEYIPKPIPQFLCPRCGRFFDVAFTDEDRRALRDFEKLLWLAELESLLGFFSLLLQY